MISWTCLLIHWQQPSSSVLILLMLSHLLSHAAPLVVVRVGKITWATPSTCVTLYEAWAEICMCNKSPRGTHPVPKPNTLSVNTTHLPHPALPIQTFALTAQMVSINHYIRTSKSLQLIIDVKNTHKYSQLATLIIIDKFTILVINSCRSI